MTLQDIAKALNLQCDSQKEILGLNTLIDSNENELTFLENKKYLSDLKSTKAAAVFVTQDFKDEVPEGTIALVCDEPYLNLAHTSKFFAPKIVETTGNEAVVAENTIVMPNVYLGKNSIIGKDCTIMAGAYIGDNVSIGDNTIIHPNVTIYRDCTIGSDCLIHAGTVIGSDGFGFANTKDGKYIKIYQNGNVTIGNDVEIGANCTIDRAVFKSTIIESGVRLDNLVHIAHNCKIGTGSILVSQVGLSGSTILNQYVIMGGQSGTAGHLEIAPFTTVAARGGVTKTITEPKKSWAGFPLMGHREWLKLQGRIAKLLK
ncbi:UDP-3-O-(3-hydroxymyristoyl)glucosamine N-acyltransferase [Poseidonibacter lekithochrous]|uniref:UDP-3-O-(3-hydroxymyristoyl)glucosamine N-acyltransferase n=1 Tax=Poseidonibacter lekithochrous TaxID=1904463 RepID=UPI000D36CD90|nr:UDP-3-O-(3-hydroxymyristoyl)glucosamine N-acyltransferase [Poseidonibacter lekithochrous]